MQPELPPQSLFEAHKALVADYQVIDQFDIQVLACCYQLFRDSDIFLRRGGISAGVIVTDDDGRAVTQDGGTIDLSGA